MAEGAGAPSFELGGHNAVEVVRRAHKAFAKRDNATLRQLVDSDLEFRPVNGLGLVEDTLHGRDSACDWLAGREDGGEEVTVWIRTMEEVGPNLVLSVGVVSERGRAGRGYAATVAWLTSIRDGRVHSICGYPSEAAAKRALSAAR